MILITFYWTSKLCGFLTKSVQYVVQKCNQRSAGWFCSEATMLFIPNLTTKYSNCCANSLECQLSGLWFSNLLSSARSHELKDVTSIFQFCLFSQRLKKSHWAITHFHLLFLFWFLCLTLMFFVCSCIQNKGHQFKKQKKWKLKHE